MLTSYGIDYHPSFGTSEREERRAWRNQLTVLLGTILVLGYDLVPQSVAQTAFGELEARAAPVIRRQCIAGANTGQLCKQNSDCPGSECQKSDVFNVSVNILDPTVVPAKVESAFTKASKLLFRVTIGQAQLGRVTVFAGATGKRGLFWITDGGGCWAHPGSWGLQNAGNIIMESSFLSLPQPCLTHEFVHTVFDGLDEYIRRDPDCGPTHLEGVSCPNSGGGFCLMSSATSGTKLCWGHAVGSNFTSGDHDAANFTAQSSCRDKRSCWDQIGWSWPNTMLVPVGAPVSPDPSGHQDLQFVWPTSDKRVVLVLDRSGSMSSGGRLDFLRVAALNIVETAEDGEQLGISSFSDSATDNVSIGTLTTDRSSYVNAINALVADGNTNIGDGLQHAHDQIIGAGGVTGQTAVLLMTDGLNNRPAGNAAANLEEKLSLLLMKDIPVEVTCVGEEDGLDTQCAKIAERTGGEFADAGAGAYQIPHRFVRFYEHALGRDAAAAIGATLSAPKGELVLPMFVEEGAKAATFVAQWAEKNMKVTFEIKAPNQQIFAGKAMTQGSYLRVFGPQPGLWLMRASTQLVAGANLTLALQGFLENPKIAVTPSLRRSVISLGERFTVCLRPLFEGPLKGVRITGRVWLPDHKTTRLLTLLDSGGGSEKTGDEIPNDGIYCGLFKETDQLGAYLMSFEADATKAAPLVTEIDPKLQGHPVKYVPFVRRAVLSVVVAKKKL